MNILLDALPQSNGHHPPSTATPRHRHKCVACPWHWSCRSQRCQLGIDRDPRACRRCQRIARFVMVQVLGYTVRP